MKYSSLLTATLLLACCLLSGCASDSAPLQPLTETYAEMADNNAMVAEAFQDVYKADRDKQESLMQKATTVAEEVKKKNEALADKAMAQAADLQNAVIPCEASPAVGFKIKEASFTSVKAQPQLANIIIEGPIDGEPSETPYFFLVDKNDEVVYKSAARVSDGKISVNFRIVANKGADDIRAIGRAVKIVFVTLEEYKAGKASAEAAPEASANAVESVAANEEPQ